MSKVRIKDHDRRPQFSIAVVVAAALLIWFAIVLWMFDFSDHAAQRELTQVAATYLCDDGHRFSEHLDTKSLACPHEGCTRRGWPVWSYQCSRDGAFVLQLRYVRDRSGRPRIKSARPPGADWQTVAQVISCPRCGRGLIPDHSLRPLGPLSAGRGAAGSGRGEGDT